MTVLAALSDIHGNRWALEAVLDDLAHTTVDATLNLGDTLWGVLDPAGTADLLMRLPMRHVRGNADRELVGETPSSLSLTDAYCAAQLTDSHLSWLAAHEPPFVVGGALACHGTPSSDSTTLLEEVTEAGVRRRNGSEVAAAMGSVPSSVSLVLCGHTHLTGIVQVPDGPLVVNPGSVGLPAYTHDEPYLHRMESGSPHARYAVARLGRAGWRIELRAVCYDWRAAARRADDVGRPDWAYQLRTGHVPPARA